jgi:hypothetical protein
MHWIFVGILIGIGIMVAPAVLTLAAIALPGMIGGVIGFFLTVFLFSDAKDPLPMILLFALGGMVAPYALWFMFKRN